MAFTKMGNFSFNHSGQPETLPYTAEDAQAKFDSRANELKSILNAAIDLLNSAADGNSGADNVGMTPIADLGTAANVQAIVEALITRLKATEDGASGSDLIGSTAIGGVTGTTVQAQMESMKGLVDGKAASDDLSGLAGTGRTTETVKGNADDLAAHLAETVISATQPHGLAKNKLDATTAPTVNDDSGDGYGVNSVWIDTTADKAYVCLDATAGGAVWKEITGGATVPACRVYHDVAQSITNASHVTLAFNSERFDTDTIHDTVTNNERLTCKTAGKYLIVVNVLFDANATGTRELALILNGATNIGRQTAPASATQPTGVTVATVYDLAVNDYVTVMVYQSSGGALNVDSYGNQSPEFMMVKVG